MLIRRPAAHSLRIDLDPRPILTESPYGHPPSCIPSPRFRHLIRVASVTGRMPERDVMLLYLPIPPAFA